MFLSRIIKRKITSHMKHINSLLSVLKNNKIVTLKIKNVINECSFWMNDLKVFIDRLIC